MFLLDYCIDYHGFSPEMYLESFGINATTSLVNVTIGQLQKLSIHTSFSVSEHADEIDTIIRKRNSQTYFQQK